MTITLEHTNGKIWGPWKKKNLSGEYFTLTNQNPLKWPDPDDGKIKANQERFYIYVAHEQSAVNGLQSGLAIRMVGIGDNGDEQDNIFSLKSKATLLFSGVPLMGINPEKQRRF